MTDVDFEDPYFSVRNTRFGRLVVQNNGREIECCPTYQLLVAEQIVKTRDVHGETLLMIGASNGYEQVCRALFSQWEPEVDVVDLAGNTALILAAQGGYSRICEFLLEKGANVNHSNMKGETALFHACLKGISLDCVQLLIRHKANLLHRNQDGLSALHRAVESEGLRSGDIVKDLLNTMGREGFLREGIEMASYQQRIRPIHIAAEFNRTRALKHLIANGADINARTCRLETPLMLATANKKLGVVSNLLDAGALPNIKDIEGHTCLHSAAILGHEEYIQRILEAPSPVDVNAQDRYGDTPIMVACKALSVEAIKEMMRHRTYGKHLDLTIGNNSGSFPLLALAGSSMQNLVHACQILDIIAPILRDEQNRPVDGADTDSSNNNNPDAALSTSNNNNSSNTFSSYHQLDRAHSLINENSLFVASNIGACAFVHRLLYHGCNPNIAGGIPSNVIPAYIACQKGFYNTVCALMEPTEVPLDAIPNSSDVKFAPRPPIATDPNWAASDGASLMIIASEFNRVNICNRLKKCGVPLDRRTSLGATPLWIALQNRHQHPSDDLVRFFIASGCNIHTCISDHANGFFLLCEKNAPRSTFELLFRACKGDETVARRMMEQPLTNSGITPLIMAVKKKSYEAVEYLCDIGCPLNDYDIGKDGAFEHANKLDPAAGKKSRELLWASGAVEGPSRNINEVVRNNEKQGAKWSKYWAYIQSLPPITSSYVKPEDTKKEKKKVTKETLQNLEDEQLSKVVTNVFGKKGTAKRRGRDE